MMPRQATKSLTLLPRWPFAVAAEADGAGERARMRTAKE